MLVGPTGGGKTSNYKTLQKVKYEDIILEMILYNNILFLILIKKAMTVLEKKG